MHQRCSSFGPSWPGCVWVLILCRSFLADQLSPKVPAPQSTYPSVAYGVDIKLFCVRLDEWVIWHAKYDSLPFPFPERPWFVTELKHRGGYVIAR